MMMRHCALALTIALVALLPRDAGAAGLGQTCGGSAKVGCDAGLWCQLPDGRCGVADLEGKCVKHGTVCPAIYRPVCGCDGRTYGNVCELHTYKAQKKSGGVCR